MCCKQSSRCQRCGALFLFSFTSLALRCEVLIENGATAITIKSTSRLSAPDTACGVPVINSVRHPPLLTGRQGKDHVSLCKLLRAKRKRVIQSGVLSVVWMAEKKDRFLN